MESPSRLTACNGRLSTADGQTLCALTTPLAEQLAQTFKALSDPTRVRIIAALVQSELCVHELTALLGMTQSAISHQLATLREMRLVKAVKQGRHVYYSLDDQHIYDLYRQGLEHIQHA